MYRHCNKINTQYIYRHILYKHFYRLGNFSRLKSINSARNQILAYFGKREGKPS